MILEDYSDVFDLIHFLQKSKKIILFDVLIQRRAIPRITIRQHLTIKNYRKKQLIKGNDIS